MQSHTGYPEFVLVKAVDDQPQRELTDARVVREWERRARLVLVEELDGTVRVVKNHWGPTGDVRVVVQHDDAMLVERASGSPRIHPVATAMVGSTDTLVPQVH